jgi:hypothetical protein
MRKPTMNQRGDEFLSRACLLAAMAGLCCGCGWCWPSRCGVPDRYPLGSVNRAHYQTMEANAEAADFILHRHEFVGETAELTPYGKDHLLEIAARARSAPFPILVERSENNSNPALDNHRRTIIAQALVDDGVGDALERTIVAPAYGKGLTAPEAQADYSQFVNSRAARSGE